MCCLTRKILISLAFLNILGMASTEEMDRTDNNGPKFKLVPGVYKEVLPSPIFYETYAPVLLKYQLPNWNKSEVTFNNWYSCITETSPFRYTCPVVFHMNKAVLNLHIDFESIQPVVDSMPHGEFYSKLFATSDFCDTIQKHFSGIYIQKQEFDKYQETLTQCHLGSGSTYIDLLNNNYNFSIRHPFTRIENNFYNTFYKNINSSLELVASATLSNARATIQATLLSAYYAEKNRWTHAIQDCRNQVIPHSVVTYAKFNESMTQFTKALLSVPTITRQELSIPLELISKYYNLPLTDCTFTEDSFISRILVPIRSKSMKVETKILYKLHPILFQYENKLCQVQVNREVEETHLYDEERHLAYKTNCKPNELCQISSVFMPDKIDPCVTALMVEDFDEFIKNCPFKCTDQMGDSKLLISRIKSDKYVFVGKAQGVLNDFGKEIPYLKKVMIETFDKYFGAFEVTLPCKSKLTVGDKVLYSNPPCDSTGSFSGVSIAPWHFARRKDEDMIDNGLMDIYVKDGQQRPETQITQIPVAPSSQSQTSSADGSSNALIWAFFSIIAIIIFSLQIFTLYQFSKLQGGPAQSIQNMFYNRRARDPEPELRLINEN